MMLCEVEGCPNQIFYGFPGQEKKRCVDHKEEGMKRGGYGLCIENGCKLIANHGFPDITPKVLKYCKRHSKEGMIDCVSGLCKVKGCRKRATFGVDEPGKRKERCGDHKEEGMQDFSSKFCEHKGCRKRA